MIKTEALTFIYPDGTKAISMVDLEILDGEFIAIMGANGSGKTSLLKLLIRLLKPSSGNISLNGNEYSKLKDRDIFESIGMVFQDPNDQLFSSTVEQDVAFGVINLGLSIEETSQRVSTALKTVGVPDLTTKNIHALSYGQKKRVALAGVLAMKPKIILLDEPTGGLDPRSITPVMFLLKKLNREQGITIVIATHDVDLVPLFCDRIIVMHEGRIIKQDSPQKIFGNPELARKVNLRTPRIAHLTEILRTEDGIDFQNIPLTISDARKELIRLFKGQRTSIQRQPKRAWQNKYENETIT